MLNSQLPMRASQTMPQLHYTREDIQEQYSVGRQTNKRASHLASRSSSKRAKSSEPAKSAQLGGYNNNNDDDDEDEDEDESSVSEDEITAGNAASGKTKIRTGGSGRSRKRQRKGKRRRRRAHSASLFSACFSIPHLGAMLQPSGGQPSRSRSILAHLCMGTSSQSTADAQVEPRRPISGSQTVGNLQQVAADERAGKENIAHSSSTQQFQQASTSSSTTMSPSSQLLLARKHVSFGGQPAGQQVTGGGGVAGGDLRAVDVAKSPQANLASGSPASSKSSKSSPTRQQDEPAKANVIMRNYPPRQQVGQQNRVPASRLFQQASTSSSTTMSPSSQLLLARKHVSFGGQPAGQQVTGGGGVAGGDLRAVDVAKSPQANLASGSPASSKSSKSSPTRQQDEPAKANVIMRNYPPRQQVGQQNRVPGVNNLIQTMTTAKQSNSPIYLAGQQQQQQQGQAASNGSVSRPQNPQVIYHNHPTNELHHHHHHQPHVGQTQQQRAKAALATTFVGPHGAAQGHLQQTQADWPQQLATLQQVNQSNPSQIGAQQALKCRQPQLPPQPPTVYRRLPAVPMRTQATQTEITAYHLMATPTSLSSASPTAARALNATRQSTPTQSASPARAQPEASSPKRASRQASLVKRRAGLSSSSSSSSSGSPPPGKPPLESQFKQVADAEDGSDEWSVEEEEQEQDEKPGKQVVAAEEPQNAPTLASSYGGSSSSSATSLVGHDCTIAASSSRLDGHDYKTMPGADLTRQAAADVGGTSIMIRNADQGGRASQLGSFCADVKLKNDNREDVCELEAGAVRANADDDIEPPSQFKDSSEPISSWSSAPARRMSNASESGSSKTLASITKEPLQQQQQEQPLEKGAFMNMNATTASTSTANDNSDCIQAGAAIAPANYRQDSTDWEESVAEAEAEVEPDSASVRAPSPPSLSEASSQTDAALAPHLHRQLSGSGGGPAPRPSPLMEEVCSRGVSGGSAETLCAASELTQLEPKLEPLETNNKASEVGHKETSSSASRDDVEADNNGNVVEPNESQTNRRCCRRGSSRSGGQMIMDNGGDNGAPASAIASPADAEASNGAADELEQERAAGAEVAAIAMAEADLGGLEPGSRLLASVSPQSEQRRDHFLTLSELETIEMIQRQSGVATTATAGSSGEPGSSRARSTTSTLSTRHHSYCSTDDFNPYQQQLDNDELLACLDQPPASGQLGQIGELDLDHRGDLSADESGAQSDREQQSGPPSPLEEPNGLDKEPASDFTMPTEGNKNPLATHSLGQRQLAAEELSRRVLDEAAEALHQKASLSSSSSSSSSSAGRPAGVKEPERGSPPEWAGRAARAQFRQSSSASPPTTVSELDQDEELSTPSFVDSYRNRLAHICQLADNLVGGLLSEQTVGLSDTICKQPDEPIASAALMRIDGRGSIGGAGADADTDGPSKPRPQADDSSSSTSSASSCSGRSSLLLASSPPGSTTSTTSASGRSYLCCHPAEQAHLAEHKPAASRPPRPEVQRKPEHLKQWTPATNRGAPPGGPAEAASAAALAVTATSIAAAAALHTSGFGGPAHLALARGARVPAEETQANNNTNIIGDDTDGLGQQGLGEVQDSGKLDSHLRDSAEERLEAPVASREAGLNSDDDCESHRKNTESVDEDDGCGGTTPPAVCEQQCSLSSLSGDIADEQVGLSSLERLEPSPPPPLLSSGSERSGGSGSEARETGPAMEPETGATQTVAPGAQVERPLEASAQLVSRSGSACSAVSVISRRRSSCALAADPADPTSSSSGATCARRSSAAELDSAAPAVLTDASPASSGSSSSASASKNDDDEPGEAVGEELSKQQRRRSQDPLSTVSELSEDNSHRLTSRSDQVQQQQQQQQPEPISKKLAEQKLAELADLATTEQDLAQSDYTLRSQCSETGALASIISEASSATSCGSLKLEPQRAPTLKPAAGQRSSPEPLDAEQRRRSIGGGDASGSGSARTGVRSPVGVDCPYVHDIIVPMSPTHSASSRSPPLLVHHQRLSHDDTMEAIEDDIEGEEQELRAQLQLQQQQSRPEVDSLAIAPPPAFGGSGEQPPESARATTPAEPIIEEEEEEQAGSANEDDEESSISISQHGVIVSQEVVHSKRTSKSSSPSPPPQTTDRKEPDESGKPKAEVATQAILEHLSRHHQRELTLDEPAPSLEARSVDPQLRREGWRRESGRQQSAADPAHDEQGGGQSAALDRSNTATMKRRRPSRGAARVEASQPADERDIVEAAPQRRVDPPLTRQTSQPATDNSICSSCSCLEQTSFNSLETQSAQSSSGGQSATGKRPTASASCAQANSSTWMSQEEGTVFTENYWLSHWLYISEHEESEIWRRAIDMNPASGGTAAIGESGQPVAAGMPKEMTEMESTQSERNFSAKYKSTTRKMIHRRATIEMYKRIMSNSLKREKRVEISRSNGEFGFRIHGSRPVVVSAIERGTSAETCGLQVGDLIYAINETNILDMAHSDVVKLAHSTDSSALVLDLVPTNDFLRMSKYNGSSNKRYEPIVTGFLMRLSPSTAQPLLIELQERMAQVVGVSAQQRSNKLNEVMRRAWRQRYFVLRNDNCLYWYRSASDIEPFGGINLQGFSASLTNEFSEPNYVIRLVKYGGQPHYLGTNNVCDIQTWIDAINKAATEANQNDPYMKRTLQLARTKPNLIPEPDCAGYLYKFSHKRSGGAHWRAAYFILKDACLYLFRDQQAETVNQASAVYYLHGYRVRSKHIEHKKHTFELVPPNKKTIRPMFLLANSETDKKRWIAALEYSIDRWIEID